MKAKDIYIFASIMLFLGLILLGLLFYQRSSAEDPGTTVSDTNADIIDEPEVTNEPFEKEITFVSGDKNLKAYVCKPKDKGPFPAVIYNHGGTGAEIDGVPEETCDFLKRSGFVGFAPIRREESSVNKNLSDVISALDYVKRLDYVDKDRIGMMGFARGGLLTFMAAAEREDLKAVIIMAGEAPSKKDIASLAEKFTASSLILVAENDTPNKLNGQKDLVKAAERMHDALETAEADVDLIIFPEFQQNGHLMFFEIGDYWVDVNRFFRKHLLGT